MTRNDEKNNFSKVLLSMLGSMICIALTAIILVFFVNANGNAGASDPSDSVNYEIMRRYDLYMNRTIGDALDGVLPIKKVYWLSDYDLVSPEPNADCFGETDDPSTMQVFLDDAQELMDGQDTLFSTDTPIIQGSKVYYYLDETIMVVTWKEMRDKAIYTISEVKIADPSQFRRFLADGEYGSSKKYYPSEMAPAVNAVTAMSGDYYAFRDMGIVVNNGQLYRMEGQRLDTCFIDTNGDMSFVYAKEMTEKADAEAYIRDRDIRFSLAFGPVLVDNGQLRQIPAYYRVGEIETKNDRAAFGQFGKLHYQLVTINAGYPYQIGHDVQSVADNMYEMGCIHAYNLDGGQTATLIMNDKLIAYTQERRISDIIYFATAVPDGE